ncbi:NmrA family NAD(P)-binding protein [Mucilaginibacter lappiensis]|uniref:NmrA family NAD(P)-binding protein n=1 Tax=Mucilaginibacter lappiensis TaxID=354630 RepID=UPI003D1BF283
MKIIVTGSLGHISKPLTQELVQKGHAVTVISSNPEKQAAIEALDATAAIGLVDDVDFLASTFINADAVFCMVPPNFAEPDQIAYYSQVGSNYAQAIGQSGIKRVVHLSSYGAHLDKGTGFIVGSHRVENILNKLVNTAITHLRPGYFYYNLYRFADMIKGAGIMGTNFGGDDKLVLVSPTDIAAVVAEEIVLQTTENKIRYVASDEHTCNEIASVLGDAIGKPNLKWLTFTDEQTQATMEKNGVSAPIAATLVELGAATHNGALRQDYDLHKPVMGKVKLADFAKEFAAAFK